MDNDQQSNLRLKTTPDREILGDSWGLYFLKAKNVRCDVKFFLSSRDYLLGRHSEFVFLLKSDGQREVEVRNRDCMDSNITPIYSLQEKGNYFHSYNLETLNNQFYAFLEDVCTRYAYKNIHSLSEVKLKILYNAKDFIL